MVTALLALIALFSAAVQGTATPRTPVGNEVRPPIPVAGATLCLVVVIGWFLSRGIVPANIPTGAWLVLSPWVHADPFHLTANLCAILLISAALESVIGWKRLTLIFLAGSYGAAIAHPILTASSPVPLAGASSGIHALLCAHALRFRHVPVGNGTGYRPTVAHVAILSGVATVIAAILLAETRWSAAAHLAGAIWGGLAAWGLGVHRQQVLGELRERAADASAAGNHDLAIHLLRTILEHSPDDLNTQTALADAFIAARHFEAAGTHVSKTLLSAAALPAKSTLSGLVQRWSVHFKNLPLTPAALLAVATWYEEAHGETRAIELLSTLCRHFPGTRDAETALLRIARIQLRNLRQPETASAVLAEFLRLYPDSDLSGHARQLLAEATPVGTLPGLAR